jgi:hypothetical protein
MDRFGPAMQNNIHPSDSVRLGPMGDDFPGLDEGFRPFFTVSSAFSHRPFPLQNFKERARERLRYPNVPHHGGNANEMYAAWRIACHPAAFSSSVLSIQRRVWLAPRREQLARTRLDKPFVLQKLDFGKKGSAGPSLRCKREKIEIAAGCELEGNQAAHSP